MAQESKLCKYCGAKSSTKTICTHCTDKLIRIRIIKAMLLDCTIEEVIQMESKRKKK